MAAHPDLRHEQAHIDRAYERVAVLRATATELLESVFRQRGGTPQALAERDVLVRTTLHRLEQLDVGSESLCFGRIDQDDDEAFHIGRLAVSSEDQEPLVVDWRAPVAEPFYRATGVHPMGLKRRRHFATEGRRLLGIEDEVFGVLGGGDGSVGTEDEDDDGLELAGAGALHSALERSRSGRMRDIVATVQREQDEIIRADMGGVLVVQGGPGTGKTAVALHRAAYLLYTYRFPLERQGVLLVGPNPVFLRYIGQVLPSLGESGVALSTIEGLVADVRVRASDDPAAARVKGDPRLVQVLARAVRDRQRPLKRVVDVGFEGFSLRVRPRDTEAIIASARRRNSAHNGRRRHVEALLSGHLYQEYQRAAERRQRSGLWVDQRAEAGLNADDVEVDDLGIEADVGEGGLDQAELWWRVRRHPEVVTALDRMWPLLTPEELLHDLYGALPLLRLAGRGILTEEELTALYRPRSSTVDAIPWTSADLPLLDEARVLLGPRTRPRPGRRGREAAEERDGRHIRGRQADEELRTYGHIVVDEAQDLTPLQLRMLARRSISGSMTVVGDVAQATGPRAPSGWEEIVSHLPRTRPPRFTELSVNYRTPSEIMDVAGRVLAVAAPHLRPPRSVRSAGSPPTFVDVSRDELADRVAVVAALEAEQVAGGTVAIISAPALVEELAAGLAGRGVAFGRAEDSGLEAQVTLIPVGTVKGLEFDAVVVVEPAGIVGQSAQGLRSLYVALTRATKRLTVVHAEALPDVLAPLRPNA